MLDVSSNSVTSSILHTIPLYICQFRSVLLKNAIAFLNKMYRENSNIEKLLDTIFNSKAVALLLKITRRDGAFLFQQT